MDDQPGRSCSGSDDATLIHRVARAFAIVDPPPPDLKTTAGELLTWRTVDEELAALLRTALLPPPTGSD